MRRIVRAFFTCSLLQSVPRHPLRANHQRRAALLLLWLVLFGPPLNDSIAGGPAAPSKGQTTPITLRFVSWKPDHPRVWDDALDEFTKAHPHISIVRELAPHSSTAYHDLLTQKLKNRDATVDVFFMDVIWVPEFAEAGWARRLDERFTPAMREEFLPATIEVGRYSDHLYGVPSRIDAGLLYYRSDLLAKYGFSPPTTWDELARQADAIVAGERRNNPTLRGYTAQFKQYEGLVCNLLEFIDGHGGSLLTSDGTHSTLGRPETLAAVQFVRDRVIGRLASRAALTYQEPESLSVFLQGHAVFHRNWPYAWELANNRTRSTIAGQVAVMPLPGFTPGRTAAALGGWLYGISAYSQHPDEAWALIEFLSSQAMQKKFTQEAGIAPSRQALFSDPDLLAAAPQLRNHLDRPAGRNAAPAFPDLSRLVASTAALFQPCPCHRRPRPCAGSGRDRRPHRSATRPHEGCAMIRAASILRNRDSLAAWTMVAPALLVTMVFALYPVLDSLWLSLHNIFIGLPQLGSPFVGWTTIWRCFAIRWRNRH
jgi:multiple sugar transport system substrate-binding protein